MITYRFNKETQILEVSYTGNILPEEIISYNEFIAENKNLPRELKVLVDARTASYQFSTKTIEILKVLVKQFMQNYKFMKVALVHSKPLETAFSQIIEDKQQPKNYFHHTFSTKEAALDWLEL